MATAQQWAHVKAQAIQKKRDVSMVQAIGASFGESVKGGGVKTSEEVLASLASTRVARAASGAS